MSNVPSEGQQQNREHRRRGASVPRRIPSRTLEAARAVVFVCSGNMVRSAFAELYARHKSLAEAELELMSLGTTYRNPDLHPRTHAALSTLGVSEAAVRAFRPRHIDDLDAPQRERLAASTTLVFGMTSGHLESLDSYPVSRQRFLLEELRGTCRSIPDPVLDPVSFEETFARVRDCVDVLASMRGAPDPSPATRTPSR